MLILFLKKILVFVQTGRFKDEDKSRAQNNKNRNIDRNSLGSTRLFDHTFTCVPYLYPQHALH